MIIGFTGEIGVGKTSVADCLVKEKAFIKLSFATPIKRALVEFTGLDMKWFTDPVLKETEIEGLPKTTPRLMAQLLGTEYARNLIFHDFFCWRMGQSFAANEGMDIVVDDVRFENEADFIREKGGKIVRLLRVFESQTKGNNHSSENGITLKKGEIEVLCMNTPGKTAEYILTFL